MSKDTKGEKIDFDFWLRAISTAGHMVTKIPTEQMLDMVERSDSVGCLFHPTLWMKAQEGGKFERMKRVIKLANDFKKGFLELMEEELKETNEVN